MINFEPFRFWCQKVLPSVYDDSLSYYDLLCKVVAQLNDVMSQVEKNYNELNEDNNAFKNQITQQQNEFELQQTNKYNNFTNQITHRQNEFELQQTNKYNHFTDTIDEKMDELMSAWNGLKSFVDNYFNNLDVQEEINSKLDSLVLDGTMQNLINVQFSGYQNQLNVLTQRMNTFASLPDGSTAGNGELMDIRVGADGTTYISAGEAVRGQVGDLKSDLDDVYNRVIRRNIFDLSKVIPNKYVEENSGNLVDYNGWSSYEFEVIQNHTYEFYAISNEGPWGRVANIYYALLDKDKNVLSFGRGKKLYEISIMQNCKYLRISQETKFLSNDRLPIISDRLVYNPSSKDMYVDYSSLVVKLGNYERDLSIDTSYSYDNTIRAISRLGDNYIYPENTLIAFEKAIAKGFRYLLAAVSWTSDGVPICLHDDTLQRTGRTTSGGIISNTNRITKIPFSEVDMYDFGVYKGIRFSGTKILKLEDFLMFCKKMGVNCYLELKHGISSNNVVNCAKLVKRYGMENNTTFVVTAKATNNMDTATEIRTVINNARIGLIPPENVTSAYVNEAISLKDNGDVFLFGWETTTFSSNEIVDMMINNDISFEVGTFDNVDSAKSFIGNHPYTKGVESNNFVIGKELLK